MPKYSALITAIIGAAVLVLQQAIQAQNFDLKVVALAVIVAIVGAASVVLKGKGATIAGVIGTVGYTAFTIYNTGHFTWGEFILTSALAILSLFAPTLIPQSTKSDNG